MPSNQVQLSRCAHLAVGLSVPDGVARHYDQTNALEHGGVESTVSNHLQRVLPGRRNVDGRPLPRFPPCGETELYGMHPGLGSRPEAKRPMRKLVVSDPRSDRLRATNYKLSSPLI